MKTLLSELVNEVQNHKFSFGESIPENEEEQNNIKLVAFLTKEGGVSASDVASLADDHQISIDDMNEQIYSLTRGLLKGIGKHNDVPDSKFDADELEKGIEVEKEHTANKYIAKMIAKDHLSELPDYYTRLHDMENNSE